MCFDWLVVGQILPMNPAAAVRGPSYVIKRGKTAVLNADEARHLLDAIDCSTIVGLRATGITAYLENGGTIENAQPTQHCLDLRRT